MIIILITSTRILMIFKNNVGSSNNINNGNVDDYKSNIRNKTIAVIAIALIIMMMMLIIIKMRITMTMLLLKLIMIVMGC